MISIVICGVDKTRYNNLLKNIKETIGTEYEILLLDNKIERLGICAVYNKMATKAKYDYICFVHEDVEFRTQNWGRILIDGYKNGTGVIGLAGGMVATKQPVSWGDNGEKFRRINISQLKHGKEVRYYENPLNEEFSEVMTLDGVLLFTTKRVWSEIKFDEENFDGFHLYDMDFSFASGLKYKNYICQTISVIHYSYGSFDKTWFDYCKKFTDKWSAKLPYYPASIDEKDKKEIEAQSLYTLIRRYLLRLNFDRNEQKEKIKEFHKLFPSDNRYISLWIKYIIRPFRHYK